MDWSLISLIVSLFAAEAALFFWEDPQIPRLESSRRRLLEDLVQKFMSDQGTTEKEEDLVSRLADFLASAYLKHNILIEPVRELTPHKKIASLLTLALGTSVVYGLLGSSLAKWNMTAFHLGVTAVKLTTFFAIITIGFAAVAFWYGLQEFRYLMDVRKLLNHDTPTSNANETVSAKKRLQRMAKRRR